MEREKDERMRRLELVRLAQQKDVDAFTQLYEEISRDLYQTAYYCLRNQQDAEDVVSETVMAAWAQIGELREAEAFRGWIFKILSNRCKTRLRQYVEKPLELREDFSDLAEQGPTLGDSTAGSLDLRAALKKLVATDRMILVLSVLEGYTTREVADMLHMNHATVRSRKSRALEKLAEMLA